MKKIDRYEKILMKNSNILLKSFFSEILRAMTYLINNGKVSFLFFVIQKCNVRLNASKLQISLIEHKKDNTAKTENVFEPVLKHIFKL